MGKLGSNPLAGLAALGLGGLATPANTGGLNPAGKNAPVISLFRCRDIGTPYSVFARTILRRFELTISGNVTVQLWASRNPFTRILFIPTFQYCILLLEETLYHSRLILYM